MFLLLERVVICTSNTHCNDFWRSVIEIAAIILIQIAFKICFFLYGNNQPDNNYLESSNDLISNHKQASNQPTEQRKYNLLLK